jgi:predicted ATPase with chaperone activity
MLVESNLVTPQQIEEALQRQRQKGGRLVENLVSLKHLREGEFESFVEEAPPAPHTLEETGLEEEFINDLTLKHMYFAGVVAGHEVAQRMRLPYQGVIDSVINFLKNEKLIEIKRGQGISDGAYLYALTTEGRRRAREVFEQSSYTGPAPVPIEDYEPMCARQTVRNLVVTRQEIEQAFEHMVLDPAIFDQLGPATNSGRSIFLFGEPGNGKTTIAETLIRLLKGGIYIPHALKVDHQVVKVFDPVHHTPIDIPKPRMQNGEVDIANGQRYDTRWVFSRRPVVEVGGELTLDMLDLEFDEVSKYYEAPLQVKANGGLFIIDDFGRQQVSPKDLLNRWILPLEKRIDFLSLHTGNKFAVPFDQLLIFATNLDPQQLVDEAFLRRIRYKVHVGDPTPAQYTLIFSRVCQARGVPFDPQLVDYVMQSWYKRHGIPMRACHPRDVVEHCIDMARFHEATPELSPEILDHIFKTYFIVGRD